LFKDVKDKATVKLLFYIMEHCIKLTVMQRWSNFVHNHV